MITKKHLPSPALPGYKALKKSIVFAENQPEIIGYREPSDDEGEDEDERLNFLRNLAGCGGGGSGTDKDDSDDLQKDPEWVALQELTQSNTLFNSKYSNFKLDGGSNGLLGQAKPTGLGLGKSDSGPIKFVIQDGNQQPLAPTRFSSNIASMTKKFSNDSNSTSTASSPTSPNKPFVNGRTSVESTQKNQNESSSIALTKPKVDHLKKPVNVSNGSEQQSTATTTAIDQSTTNQRKFAIEKLNIDKIRIPRASIQDASKSKPSLSPPSPPVVQPPTPPLVEITPTTNSVTNNNNTNKEKEIGANSNIKANNQNITKKEVEISKSVAPIKQAPNLKPAMNDSTNTSPTDKCNESVVVVDSVDGSILTLDSKKLKNRSVHDKDTEMFLLNHRNHLRHNHNQHHHDNLDTLSQSSASSSSGCCSANSSSSPTPPSSSTSPTNTECCSSPSPDSLDSTPDSYDLVKDDDDLRHETQDARQQQPNADCLSVEACHDKPQQPPAVPQRSINNIHYPIISPKPSTISPVSDKVVVSSDKNDHPNLASSDIDQNVVGDDKPEQSSNQLLNNNVQLQSMKLFANNELEQSSNNHLQNNLVNNNKKSNASIFSTSSSMVGHDNINNKTTISINYRSYNPQLTESAQLSNDSGSNDPLSRNNSQNRNQMLARLAQDLQKHRSSDSSSETSSSSSNTNIDQANATTLASSHNSLLRSNSAQSNLSSSAMSYVSANSNSASNSNLQFAPNLPPNQQYADSFRERLFREAREENEERSIEEKKLGSKLKNQLLKGKKLLKPSSKSDESNCDSDSEDSDCDIALPDMIQDNSDEEEVVDYSTNSETDDDEDGGNKHRRSESKNSSNSSSYNTNSSVNSAPEAANKPNSVSSLFKNVVNSNKKYTKMVKKNINKTSKFIVQQTYQLRSDTNDMVRKFKNNNDKGSKYYPSNDVCQPEEYEEQHKKSKSKFGFMKNGKNKQLGKQTPKTWDENHLHQSSNSLDFNNQHSSLTSSMSANSEGPQLLGLKRLDSFFEPASTSINAPNSKSSYNESSAPSANIINSDINPRRSAPPIPVRNYQLPSSDAICPIPEPDIPPQAPIRRKRLSKTNTVDCDKLSALQSTINSPTTLAQLKIQFENELNVSAIHIDDYNSIERYVKIENTSKNSKLYKMFQCSSSSSSNTGRQSQSPPTFFNLLISSTVWTTCYDWPVYGSCDELMPKFKGTPCRIVSQKWQKFVTLSSFCEQLNLIDSMEQRSSLMNSLMLQLYTILERLEYSATSDSLKRFHDNAHGLRFKPRTVVVNCDKNEVLVGISYSSKTLTAESCNKITDCLLLLPTKDFDETNDDDKNSNHDDGQPESFSMMQAFCLQVFLYQIIRLTDEKLITIKRNNKDHRPSSHSISERSNQCNSMRELKTLHAVEIFDIAPQSDANTVEGSIKSWFENRNNLKQYMEKFNCVDSTNNSDRLSNSFTILDYLEADYALQSENQQFAIDLIQKERTRDSN